MNARPVPVVLDVDTGVDDACALLLAARHPALDLRAVTCVGGNATVDDVVANTLTVLDVAGRADVPVARGAASARAPGPRSASAPSRPRAARGPPVPTAGARPWVRAVPASLPSAFA